MLADSISIVIPTHNRAELVAQAMRSLKETTFPEGTDVELIVVANACTDNTRATVEAATAGMPIPVLCVDEPRLSVSIARNRGVRESGGEIIAFLDDDVRVEPEWLNGLADAFRTLPADIVAGRVRLWWDGIERPEWFSERHAGLLSALDHGDQVVEVREPTGVVGANFAFRRPVFDAVNGFRPELGRRGGDLLGYDEVEFVREAMARKFRILYAPEAIVHHQVRAARARPEYLCAVARGHARSSVYIERRWSRRWALSKLPQWVWRSAFSLVKEAFLRVLGRKGALIERRVRRHRNLGKIAGAWDRLIGRSPLDDPTA